MIAHTEKERRSLMMFRPKTPHFFKIVLDENLNDGKLGIPRKFVRDYGNHLPESILLKVPSGGVWEVELMKCDGDVWLHSGWNEFADYYSLSHGYFLIFKYDYMNCFHVVIFDTSCSEVDYPSRIINGNHQKSNLEKASQKQMMDEHGDDSSVEILTHSPVRCRKTKEKSLLLCNQPNKKARTNIASELEGSSTVPLHSPNSAHSDRMKPDPSVKNAKLHDPTIQQKEAMDYGGMCTPRLGLNIVRREKKLICDEKVKAIRTASSAFKSEKPFFIIAIQPSYVRPPYKLSIPSPFAKRYLAMHSEAVLRVSDSKRWSVGYYNGPGTKRTKPGFSHGWKNFAIDNCLKVGDVCIFELITCTKLTFKVIIFPAAEDTNGGPLPDGEPWQTFSPVVSATIKLEVLALEDNPQAKYFSFRDYKERVQRPHSKAPASIDAVANFASTHPFFNVTIRSYNIVYSNVAVPLGFFKKHVDESTENVMLQIKNRSWPVKFYQYPQSGQGRFSAGWRAFVRENSLKVGDVCVFELIKSNPLLLKASIFRDVV